tara:strand:- start:381 stop:965 length:585 start_codon:yes stop_codon:yes gene_type:complete
MNKFIIYFFVFFLFSFKSYGAQDGRGDLQLTEQAVNSFIRYIKGDTGKGRTKFSKPMALWISNDGNLAYWWYCPYEKCAPANGLERKFCEKESNQSCSRFARGRYVRWNNGINPKGKAAKFSREMTENEIKNKLTKLGFYKNNLAADTEISESNEQTISKDKSLVEQLEKLTQMFQDGLINETEFKTAKKKLLE